MARVDMYRTMNDHAVSIKVFWHMVKEEGWAVPHRPGVPVPDCDNSAHFKRSKYFFEFQESHNCKKLSLQKIGLEYREAYDDLYTFFINRHARGLIKSLSPSEIGGKLYYELEATKYKQSNALEIEIMNWFVCYVQMDIESKKRMHFYDEYRVFWSEYLNFLRPSKREEIYIRNGELSETRGSHLELSEQVIDDSYIWQIAIALNMLCEVPDNFFQQTIEAYKWCERHVRKKGKKILANSLQSQFSKKINEYGGKDDELRISNQIVLKELVCFFKSKLTNIIPAADHIDH